MKISVICLALALATSIKICYAQHEKRVKAEIKAATIFLQRAQITSEVRTEVEAGNSKITLAGLPTYLNSDEILLSGKGEAVIVGMSFRTKSSDQLHKSREYRMLADSAEHLKFEMDSITNMEEILRAEEQLIYANKEIRSNEKGVKAHELEDVADIYRERLVLLRAIILKNRIKTEKLNPRLQTIQEKLAGFNNNSGELIIELHANSKTPVVIEATYIIDNAGWVPFYDFRAKNLSDAATISFKAKVYQYSHQSWDNIKLTLSTGIPDALNTKPLLQPRYLSFYNLPAPGRAYKKSMANASPMSAYNTTDSPKEAEVAEEVNLQTLENQIAIGDNPILEYDINLPYSIPAEGVLQTVDIKTEKITPHYSFYAAPAIEKDPYMIANIIDWEKLNLLSGKINVYVDGSIAGSTNIDTQNLSDTLQIAVRKDKKINILREKIKDFTSKKFIGTNVRQEYGYALTIRNTNKEEVNLTLIDQIPVSTDSQIEVEFTNDCNATYDKTTGKLTWDLHLAPTETKKIIFKYAVKYPKDKIVSGL